MTCSLGMTTQQAQALLGPPQSLSTQELQGMMVETWNYLDRTLTCSDGVLQNWQMTTRESASP